MSDNPRPPRRPLGNRDENDKDKPFGGRFGERPPDKPRPVTSPTDPYPWAEEEDQSKPAPPPDPNRLDPTAPYPWAGDDAQPKPATPPDPNKVDPTAPYPWAAEDEEKKPDPPRDAQRLAPTAPYPWAEDGSAGKPAPPRDTRKIDPTAPYPWAAEGEEKKPDPPRDAQRLPPTAPYPWASEESAEKPAPARDARKIDPTAPYSWAEEKAEDRAAARPNPNRVDPTAPYPWSDEAPVKPPASVPAPRPPAEPAPADPLAADEGPDPGNLSWADLIAGMDQADAAPPEADLVDEAPLEPLLPSEASAADRPRLSDAARSLPNEKEAPPERVTDRFLKRGAFLKRSTSASIPARSYLESDAPPPEPIVIQVVPLLRTLGVIIGSAALVATLFTWWTPNSFLPAVPAGQLAIAQATQGSTVVAPTIAPTVSGLNNIGIVSGHRGINPSSGLPDPGAVCADGLTEESINATIATKVDQLLEAAGYQVTVFDEFDPGLQGFRALAMVSIHADSCQYVNDEATGFKVASFQASTQPERDARLVNCMVEHYADRTGMPLHQGVTFDMTDYHNFREIDAQTPGIIIETGFLYLDRSYLTSHPDDVAHGIADGVLCFIRGEPTIPTPPSSDVTDTGPQDASPTPTITPTPTELGALFTTPTPSLTPLPPDQITPAP